MVKSLILVAFAAAATAVPAPQLGLLSGLNALKPGSRSKTSTASADKASPSAEHIDDTLSYNQPLKDDDDDDWKKWVYEDPKPSATQGTPIGFEDPIRNTTTVARLSTSTSTRSTTLQQLKTTTAPVYSTTVRDEIPAYSTPVTQKNEVQSYEAPKQDKQPESYQTSTKQNNEVAQKYTTSSTVQADLQSPTPYHSSKVEANVQKSSYAPQTTQQAKVQEPYAQTTQQAQKLTSSYEEPKQNDVAPATYKRDVPQGYGHAEFSKTSRAAACAVKPSAAVSPMPAVSSAPPAFRQTVESAQPSQQSSPAFAAAKESSSPVWSATPYSAPVAKPAVTEKQSYTTIPEQAQQLTSTITTTTPLPKAAATTPLADAAVASDAKILVNTLRPASIAPESTEDAKLNTVYATQGTTALDKVAPTFTASVATAPASKLLQPLYPTTTGASNATMGRPAASTGAMSNNTLPEFEGAAASSSSFVAGSVIALAIAAFAL